jgi:flagellar biosynthesis protein FlhF
MGQELRYLRDLLENQLGRLAWVESERCDPLRASLARQLIALGLHRRIAEQVVASVPTDLEAADAWRATAAALTNRIRVTGDTLLEHGGVVALLGATGVGKTTTVAKLAARFAIRHGPDKVALITTDSYRVGAHEQLRTFGRIIDIPVVAADEARALRQALEQFYDRRLVLIDTAGMSQRDVRFSEQIRLVGQGSPRIMNLLVLSATSEHRGAEQAMQAFGGARLDGCVLTKLDECTALGNALSVALQHDVPVAYISDGQRVPEDLRAARPEDLVERAVELAGDRLHEGAPGRSGIDFGFEEAARA